MLIASSLLPVKYQANIKTLNYVEATHNKINDIDTSTVCYNGMLGHSLATLEGEEEFIDFHGALPPLKCFPLSLFTSKDIFSFCHFNYVHARLSSLYCNI